MRVQRRRFPRPCLWALLLCASAAWAAGIPVTDGNYGINGKSNPKIEYGAAESFEITSLAVLVLDNRLPDDAIIEVLVDGSPAGLQVLVPSRATGVFTTRGLIRVSAGSTFGYQWFTADPGPVLSAPSASVRFTLHTRPLPSAPVSTSSAVGLGLLALLLAAFSFQRLRTAG